MDPQYRGVVSLEISIPVFPEDGTMHGSLAAVY